jgi:DNA-nicking Smr family endonuclease
LIVARQPFTTKDQHLWDDIRMHVRPLRARPVVAGKHTGMAKLALHHEMPRNLSVPVHTHAAPPPLSGFDRRTAQKLSRGQLEPDSRLDLHGQTVAAARQNLHHFLRTRQQRGDRLVLVITGKGASPYAGHTLHGHRVIDSPEREGKLRRELPLWLQEEAFRVHVIGYQPAHPRHGGGGAFYVRLRRTTVSGHDALW